MQTLTPVWMGFVQSVEGLQRRTSEGKILSSLPPLSGLGHQPLPALELGSTPLLLLVLKLWLQTGTIPPASLGLQFADGQLWNFSYPIIV